MIEIITKNNYFPTVCPCMAPKKCPGTTNKGTFFSSIVLEGPTSGSLPVHLGSINGHTKKVTSKDPLHVYARDLKINIFLLCAPVWPQKNVQEQPTKVLFLLTYHVVFLSVVLEGQRISWPDVLTFPFEFTNDREQRIAILSQL